MSNPSYDEDLDEERPPSRSQLKREAAALQVMGESLLKLNASELAQLDLPETLKYALEDALRFDSNEAKRRQRQYIGKLMRTLDPEPIQALLTQMQQSKSQDNLHHHTIERWRDRLIAEAAHNGQQLLTQLMQSYPQLDLQRLRQLLRNTVREQHQGKPPKAYREIYHLLAETIVPAP